jgi:hypothetical protein
MEDLLFFVVKGYMFISIMDSQWLRPLAMCQNPKVVFPNKKTNGATHHPFLGGQNHGPLCHANSKFLCDNNCFF